jgi:ribosome-associated heat shock protein Hsp15
LARRDPHGGGDAAPDAAEKIRADKWLFYARFFKTRALASGMITKGRFRLNGQRQPKPGHAIGAGDVLVFSQAKTLRTIRVLATTDYRGPAPFAQTLYVDLDPSPQGGAATSSALE